MQTRKPGVAPSSRRSHEVLLQKPQSALSHRRQGTCNHMSLFGRECSLSWAHREAWISYLLMEQRREGNGVEECLPACYPHEQEDSQVTQGFQSVQRGKKTSEYQHMVTATKNLQPASAKKRKQSQRVRARGSGGSALGLTRALPLVLRPCNNGPQESRSPLPPQEPAPRKIKG